MADELKAGATSWKVELESPIPSAWKFDFLARGDGRSEQHYAAHDDHQLERIMHRLMTADSRTV